MHLYSKIANMEEIIDDICAGNITKLKQAYAIYGPSIFQMPIYNPTIMQIAAKSGNLPCLRFAYEHGCPWDREVGPLMVKYGHLSCLKYAAENGYSLNESLLNSSLIYGHLNCLQYIYECGCTSWPNGVMACIYAANSGYLDCLIYAHTHGCPFTAELNRWANARANLFEVSSKQFACCQYILTH